MRFLIVDQCSSLKVYPDDAPVASEEQLGRSPAAVIQALESVGVPAGELYNGKQQQRIDEGVRTLRNNGHDADRQFISAGFGLVDERTELPPYDVTFSGMSTSAIKARSDDLAITQDLVALLTDETDYDVVFLPLGADYYTALDMNRVYGTVASDTLVAVFNRESDEQRDQVVSLPARLEQARENGSTVIGLKGTYIKRFAAQFADRDGPLDADAVRELSLQEETGQSGFEDFQ